MDKNSVIKVTNLGKKYQLGERQSYLTLRDSIMQILHRPVDQLKENKEDFWALKDVSFSVNRGEVLGIIGKNGSGKSTLLKILSRITEPTQGKAVIRGTVASLLEVGTGFNPELTGRENIYLNGSILGMNRKEIKARFDEIVDFSGVEKFLDTPVKRYSSGMYVRLAFSVAAHLTPEILIIDEVLAVGDAEFQKKCLGKMDSVAKSGRTVLFVSHNMAAVRRLCPRSILLQNGEVIAEGKTQKVIHEYLHQRESRGEIVASSTGEEKALIDKVTFFNSKKQITANFSLEETFSIIINYQIKEKIRQALLGAEFYSDQGILFLLTTDSDSLNHLVDRIPGSYQATLTLPKHFLIPGKYFLTVTLQTPGEKMYHHVDNISFTVEDQQDSIRSRYFKGRYYGFIAQNLSWQTYKE